MDDLDRKIIAHFPGKIVRKDLTNMLRRGVNVPTFVLEYLLGMYCATDDEAAIAEGVEKIRKILSENYIRPEESEKVKSLIRERGEYTIIDKVSAVLDEYNDYYVARFANLEIAPFVLQSEYAVQYTKILMGGIWCIARLSYTYPEDSYEDERRRKKKRSPEDSPFRIESLKPIQMPNLDLDDVIGQRKYFTTQEWMDMLLRSEGLEPEALQPKEKLHFLERMAPLVERNYNLCELGPRGTGKSHLYKEISPYAILLSGGQTTTANLFFNMRAMHVGLVGHWDCVAFDEISGLNAMNDTTLQILKDYMASGSFTRGRDMISADASMVFEGNINDSVGNLLKVSHLFSPFPPDMNNDSAFFDRMHYYLPGWEIPKMRSEMITGRYGLITDCLAEMLRGLRKEDFSHRMDDYVRLNGQFNKRDENAVRKTMSALTKLLFPDGEITQEETLWLLDYAIEGRRRVKEQLRLMAGAEFSDVGLGYTRVQDGPEVEETIVPVPEQSSSTLVSLDSQPAGHVFAIGVSLYSGELSVYRLENKAIHGSGKMETQGVRFNTRIDESVNAAWFYFKDNFKRLFPGALQTDKDYLMYYRDLQGQGRSAEISMAEWIGLCGASIDRPALPSLIIAGELTLSGTTSELTGVENIVRVAKNAGARRLLLPIEAMEAFMHCPRELLEAVQPIFYLDPIDAARKALDLN